LPIVIFSFIGQLYCW